jgi:hypothetical protein
MERPGSTFGKDIGSGLSLFLVKAQKSCVRLIINPRDSKYAAALTSVCFMVAIGGAPNASNAHFN